MQHTCTDHCNNNYLQTIQTGDNSERSAQGLSTNHIVPCNPWSYVRQSKSHFNSLLLQLGQRDKAPPSITASITRPCCNNGAVYVNTVLPFQGTPALHPSCAGARFFLPLTTLCCMYLCEVCRSTILRMACELQEKLKQVLCPTDCPPSTVLV